MNVGIRPSNPVPDPGPGRALLRSWPVLAAVFLDTVLLMGLVPLHYEVSTWATRKDLAYKARADQYTFAYETRPAK